MHELEGRLSEEGNEPVSTAFRRGLQLDGIFERLTPYAEIPLGGPVPVDVINPPALFLEDLPELPGCDSPSLGL
ncbi:MAG TPA: hypothetical protein VFO14_16035 [Vicinamibacterales bacterium]|nr:hypothetical protein [Vicinamibacterales bacterium]